MLGCPAGLRRVGGAAQDLIRITKLCHQHTECSQQTDYLRMYHSQNALKVVSGRHFHEHTQKTTRGTEHRLV